MISVKTVLKILLQLGLFIIFLFDYGLPSIYKFLEEKTIRIKLRKETGGIEAPSITIAARTPNTGLGWFNKSEDIVHDHDSLRHQCKDFDDIVDCIRNQTYEQTDFIRDIVIGYEEKVSLLTPTTPLVEDFTNVRYGRTYTLNPGRRIGPNYDKDEIILLLDPALIYSVILHDKRFFLMSENPYGIPSIYIKIDPSRTFGPLYTIDVTRHKNLNVPDSPCEEDSEYDFSLCVKESLSRSIGCRFNRLQINLLTLINSICFRLAWDTRSDQDIRKCTRLEEYQEYEVNFHKIRHEEFQIINSLTGCPRPCQYNEYRLLSQKRPTSFQTEHFPIAFSSRTRATTEEHEELLYPW